ncbi:unnamed protein product [Phytomonas sp. Hart1]|nr:unnamed protein product [Phytomonas sp. Hart1]|eukprot:CCW70461.1 unnamed protein product [Phytomonas sp. isolate Hart1]
MSCKNDLAIPVAPEVKIPILNANRKLHLTGAMTKSIFNRTTTESIPLPLQRELKVFECSNGVELHKRSDAIIKDSHPPSADIPHFTPLSLSLRHNFQYCHSEQTLSQSKTPAEIRIPKRSPSPEPAPPAPSSRESYAQEVKMPSVSFAHPTAVHVELKRPGESIASGLVPKCLNDETPVVRLVERERQSCAGDTLSNHNTQEGKQQATVREGGTTTLLDQNYTAKVSSRSGSPSPHIVAVESHNCCSTDVQESSYSPRTGSSRYHYLSDFPSKSQPSDIHSLKGETRSCMWRLASSMGGSTLHNTDKDKLEAQSIDHVEDKVIHPTWQPCIVKEIRPAWNQRIPPSKLRPVVSVAGSKAPQRRSPSSSRVRTMHGEEKSMVRTWSLCSKSRSNVSPDEMPKTVPGKAFIDRTSFQQSHAQPEHANKSKSNPVLTQPASITRRKSRPASVTPRAMSDVTPPSVRILFRNQNSRESSAADRTLRHIVLGSPSTTPKETKNYLDSIQKQVQLTQQSAQIAVERATHAEARCAELEKQLQESEIQRRRDREDFASNLFRLAGKVNFAVEWIHSYERDPASLEDRSKKEAYSPIYGEDRVRLGDEYQKSTPDVQGATPTPERSITSTVRLPFSSSMIFEMRS